MTGVSMLLLGMGSLFELLGGAAVVIAALVPALFYLRGENRTGMMVYAATSVLAVLLLHDKFVSLMYALVFGLYTVIKFAADRQVRRVSRWLRKAPVVMFWTLATMALIRLGFLEELPALSPVLALCLFAGWSVFLLYYDFCLTRIFAGLRRLLTRLK